MHAPLRSPRRRLQLSSIVLVIVLALAVPALSAFSPDFDRVDHLPGLDGPLLEENYAGFVGVGRNASSRLFYYLSAARNATRDPVPLVVWLNGGPGASSLTGAFSENGPYLLAARNATTAGSPDPPAISANKFSWNERYHTVFVDQPVGTGFSHCAAPATNASRPAPDNGVEDVGGRGAGLATSCLVRDLDEAADQLAELLAEILFGRHAGLCEDSPLFLTGESFAGKFVPFTAGRILDAGDAADPRTRASRLADALRRGGAAIGNPEMDTLLQYPPTVQYLRGRGLLGPREAAAMMEAFDAPAGGELPRATPTRVPGRFHRAGVFTEPETQGPRAAPRGCRALVQRGAWTRAADVCEAWLDALYPPAGDPFRYDVRKPAGAFRALTAALSAYLARPDVGAALRTGGARWSSGDGESAPNRVAEALVGWIERPGAVERLASVLDRGVRVLVYDGAEDGSPFNHLSAEACAEAMSWSGDAEFARAEHVPVRLSAERARSGDSEFAVETVSGFARTAGRFAYVVVKGAGHLVPMDRPAVAAGMMGSFVEGALRGEDADRWFVRGERLEGRGSGREASAGTGSGLRRE